MWSKLKSWHPEDRTALVCTIVVLAGTAAMVTLRFTYRPGFKIGSTILFIGACVLFGMLGLAALLIAPFLIYILLVEPLRDWYFARKYGWAKARNPRFREWLARQVESLREFGFFEEFEDLSEKQRLTRITSRLNKQFDLHSVVRAPCLIAAIDRQRAWFEDTEDERWSDGEGYVEFLGELAGISGGAFDPEEITSESEPDGKAARLHFRHKGSGHDIRVKTEDDWMDLDVIDGVNRAIRDSGIQFVTPRCNTGQQLYLVCLSDADQNALRQRASWRF